MGILITIDGLDGSGKQTQSEILYNRLTEAGIKAKIVSFPDYDSKSSALVKMYLGGEFSHDPSGVNPYAASAFFAVDRVASYITDWKEDYESGTVIIANRYTTANAIHQLSKIDDGAERESFLKWLYDTEFSKFGIPSPNMTVFLEVPVDISLALIKARSEETGREIDIHENAEHLTKAYNAALFSAKKLNWNTVHCAENKKMRTRESIADEIYCLVSEILK